MRIRKENEVLNVDEINMITKISDALAHPFRVELFKYILQSNRNFEAVYTKKIVSEFGYAQATISQHMKVLLISGLVTAKDQDKYTYYYANLGVLTQYLDTVKKFSTSF